MDDVCKVCKKPNRTLKRIWIVVKDCVDTCPAKKRSVCNYLAFAQHLADFQNKVLGMPVEVITAKTKIYKDTQIPYVLRGSFKLDCVELADIYYYLEYDDDTNAIIIPHDELEDTYSTVEDDPAYR